MRGKPLASAAQSFAAPRQPDRRAGKKGWIRHYVRNRTEIALLSRRSL